MADGIPAVWSNIGGRMDRLKSNDFVMLVKPDCGCKHDQA